MKDRNNVVISVDAMGGDNAPSFVISAMNEYAKQNPEIQFILCGIENEISPLLSQYPSLSRYIIKIIYSGESVKNDDDPIHAFRTKKNSSMRLAIEEVHNNNANAILSCGNTGALMVTGKMLLHTLNSISRPAIIAPFPTYKNDVVILDLGANTEINEQIVLQFAIMGSSYSKIEYGIKSPKVGMLNVGNEDNKGRTIERKGHILLQNSNINYCGFIEPHQVINGDVDVVVTDGFSGNIFLKSAEGTAKFISKVMKKTVIETGILGKIGSFLLRSHFKKVFKIINPSRCNGAMLIGLNGIIVKSHSGADIEGITNALGVAYRLAKYELNTKICSDMEEKMHLFQHLEDKKIS
ncbi:phosphate acyltransferase PlsX [Candidatus Fokinia crypta]|uniref:Phosphate acyltransferase n=1 Tax=Candidatus Fokinia crypta TaxID=1920990 RepID=A0ABZ0UNP2_9RICK|nr:phosphate acyltransferase PlsX [Candidatus Fokinia cryptica]WPX97751.1 Phosphate acyltransferase PlsX [Candidatus Fokinia cryptica]